ncbi:anaphase-promoting complex subunit 5-domain-containing protein [Polychytrium aggregatum]|uniref:anaphase-promoting complex subunit 5-domain-containing protein n=1 Tax=Polychytrium aggregatum TaxID=110093 RepID=UPI0022FEE1CD|nr:anaphase-promoting complex subunit 5-domain-containing protein [Polychytrium aggregatum]KAI9207820.1 anaphase-promoting complex subunit 5-domain-containing protein [Polychytrium aggregatum]
MVPSPRVHLPGVCPALAETSRPQSAHILSASTSIPADRAMPTTRPPQRLYTRFLTPHKITVMFLIEQFNFFRLQPDQLGAMLPIIEKEVHALESDLINVSVEPALSEFLDRIRMRCSPEIAASIDDKLAEIESPDDLFAIFEKFQALYQPSLDTENELSQSELSPMDGNSAVGLYVRQACLEFREMGFEQVVPFFDSFMAYKTSSAATGASWPSGMAKQCPPSVISVNDEDLLLQQQLSLLLRYGPTASHSVQSRIALVHRSAPENVRIHFVNYLKCVCSREFQGALDNLHRFFDLWMISEPRPMYHYALLHLALLYYRFECPGEALAAVNSAIVAAQELKDEEGLDYAVNWKQALIDRYPEISPTSQRTVTERPADTAGTKGALPVTQISQTLRNIQTDLMGAASPESTFQHLQQASEFMYSQETRNAAIESAYRLTSATAWDIYGFNKVAHQHSEQSRLLSDDSGSSLSLSDLDPNHELSICRHALHLAAQGDVHGACEFLSKQYKQSRASADKQQPLAASRRSKTIERCLEGLLFNDCLRRNNLDGAKQHQLAQASWAETREDGMDCRFQEARLLQANGKWTEAFSVLSELLEEVSDPRRSDRIMAIPYLLEISKMFIQTSNIPSAIPLILTSLKLAEHYSYHDYKLRALIQLADALRCFSSVERALWIIGQVLDQIYGVSDLEVIAEAFFVSAKCLIQTATDARDTVPSGGEDWDRLSEDSFEISFPDSDNDGDDDAEGDTHPPPPTKPPSLSASWGSGAQQVRPAERLGIALEHLTRSLAAYRKLRWTSSILQVLHLQACLHNRLGQTEARDAVAQEYLDLTTPQTDMPQTKRPSTTSSKRMKVK